MKDEMEIIARIRTGFSEKFGLPRQSGLAESLTGRIIFEKKYRVKEAFRGLEGYDYIWIIWKFSEAVREKWSPTVRPPRLGGNKRVGVFATRSPFRPNPIGLSCVRLEKIDYDDPEGPVINVSGIDMLDGTPVYDIKPYLPYADAKRDSRAGFADEADKKPRKELVFAAGWDACLDEKDGNIKKITADILALDPRPSYQDDPGRVYGFEYSGYEIKFRAEGGVITVLSVVKK